MWRGCIIFVLFVLSRCGGEITSDDLESSDQKNNEFFIDNTTQNDIEIEINIGEDSSPPPECLKHEECPEEKFCDEAGVCKDDICKPGDTYCFSDFEMNICDSYGSGYAVLQCAEDQKCAYGECREIICTYPWKGCYDGMVAECDETGTKYKLMPCQMGQVCDNSGKCQMNYSYIYVILDNHPYDEPVPVYTSYNAYKEYKEDILSEGDIDQCLKDHLNDPYYVNVVPAENFEICSGEPPFEKYSGTFFTHAMRKYVLREMLRYLQNTSGLFLSVFHNPMIEKECELCKGAYADEMLCPGFGGPFYSCPSEQATFFSSNGTAIMMSLCGVTDENYYMNKEGKFEIPYDSDVFQKYLSQFTLLKNSPIGAINFKELFKWIDYKETIKETGGICESDTNCATGFCYENKCVTHEDPEISPIVTPYPGGYSSGGLLLYRTGEFIRNLVRIQGRECKTDMDCDSPGYNCIMGKCHDEARNCREHDIVMIFNSDQLENFIYSVIIAKKFKNGAFCEEDKDCLNGTKCELFVLNEEKAYKLCGGIKPLEDSDLAYCFSPLLINYQKEYFYQTLFSPSGENFSVTTHIIIPPRNSMYFNHEAKISRCAALWGGGEYVDFTSGIRFASRRYRNSSGTMETDGGATAILNHFFIH